MSMLEVLVVFLAFTGDCTGVGVVIKAFVALTVVLVAPARAIVLVARFAVVVDTTVFIKV